MGRRSHGPYDRCVSAPLPGRSAVPRLVKPQGAFPDPPPSLSERPWSPPLPPRKSVSWSKCTPPPRAHTPAPSLPQHTSTTPPRTPLAPPQPTPWANLQPQPPSRALAAGIRLPPHLLTALHGTSQNYLLLPQYLPDSHARPASPHSESSHPSPSL